MLINNFIKNISSKRFYTVKQMISRIKRICFTNAMHDILLYSEALCFHNMREDGKNFNNLHMNEFIVYKFFVPYAVEKLICYSSNTNVNTNLNEFNFINDIQNSFNEAGNIKLEKENNMMSKVMFFLGYEQITVQEKSYPKQEMIRLLELYKEYPEVDKMIVSNIGLSLSKIIILTFGLLSIVIDSKRTFSTFKVDTFRKKVLMINKINEDDIKNFLDFILIDIKEFKKMYFDLRSTYDDVKEKDRLLDYSILQEVDKFMPKISYLYPFIISESGKEIILTCLTSLLEFFKLERFYKYIYENEQIKNFKKTIHGPAIEKYLKNFAYENTDALLVHGDEEYSPSRKFQYHAPDIIIEFDTYIIIIECKSKPFNLVNSLVNYESSNFEKLNKDIKKSEDNINRYLKYHSKFTKKKILKFVAYLFPNPTMLNASFLNSETINNLTEESIIVTNIRSIEYFLQIKSKQHDKIFKEYIEATNANKISSLYDFLIKNYNKEYENKYTEEKFDSLLREFFE